MTDISRGHRHTLKRTSLIAEVKNMSITNRSVSSGINTNNENERVSGIMSYEKLYWSFFAGLGLLIGCSFVVLNLLF